MCDAMILCTLERAEMLGNLPVLDQVAASAGGFPHETPPVADPAADESQGEEALSLIVQKAGD